MAESHENARPNKTVTELAVELTMAWLKRVEGTADGREPNEVVQAMDEFYKAIDRHHREERAAEPGSRAPAPPPPIGAPAF